MRNGASVLKESYYRLSILRARMLGIQVKGTSRLALLGTLKAFPGSNIIIGDHVNLYRKYVLEAHSGGTIEIEAGVTFAEGVRLTAHTNARIVIGKGVFVNRGVVIDAIHEVSVGEDALLGPDCYITDFNHGIARNQRIKEQTGRSGTVRIGTDVWLGVGATVLLGAQIGDGAIIAARGVVNKQVPAFEIWGGIPARKIGERPEDEGAKVLSANDSF